MSIDFLTTKLRFLGKIFPDVSLNIPDLSALKMPILVFFCVTNAKKTGIKQVNLGISLPKTRLKYVQNSRNKATILLENRPIKRKM